MTALTRRVLFSLQEEGIWSLSITMVFAESFVFLFGYVHLGSREMTRRLDGYRSHGAHRLSERLWQYAPTRSFRIGEEDLELSDVDAESMPIELDDWRPTLGDASPAMGVPP